jgi:hypothetical protein
MEYSNFGKSKSEVEINFIANTLKELTLLPYKKS